MRAAAILLLTAMLLPAADPIRLQPPLWNDADRQPIRKPREQRTSEMYAILYNTWVRHLSPEHKASGRRAALNVNAWDEVPDSSWFTNRIGGRAMGFEEIVRDLGATAPAPPPWSVTGVVDEGYTPKLRVRDSAGRNFFLKFDLPAALERNSGAERICTLVFHAAGYNVPGNTISYFRAADLHLDRDAVYRDSTGKKRPMTAADVAAALAKLKSLPDGRYRGLASAAIAGADLGKFRYTGTRQDDANDRIPHELRRELRGLYVLASWVNHPDVGDKNTFDAYIGKDGQGFVRHYLMDFGSTLGSGDFTNGPYRVGHEYLFDGAAMGRSLVTFGIWRRPWDRFGLIRYPEIGYYDAGLFEPGRWKPNYPNLAFLRMDDADAYWAAKVVSAFDDALIERLAAAGEYSRPEAARYLAETLRARRDMVVRHWFARISPLEDFTLEGGRLRFRDLAVERGYAEARKYQLRFESGATREFRGTALDLGDLPLRQDAPRDRYGRTPLSRVWLQAEGALPVEVIVGRNGDTPAPTVLGWRHAARKR